MKRLKSSLLFSSGFAGGLLAGWIISSCKNPEAFENQKEQAELALSKMNQAVKEGVKKLREINARLKYELSHPIPDLYSATEGLSLDETDLFYE